MAIRKRRPAWAQEAIDWIESDVGMAYVASMFGHVTLSAYLRDVVMVELIRAAEKKERSSRDTVALDV